MKKQFLIFAAGLVAGGAIVSGVFFITDKTSAAEKNDCSLPAGKDSGCSSEQVVEFFPPMFSKEQCRQWNNCAEYLMQSGYNHSNRDMAMASGLISFTAEVELYIWANEKARALSGKAREDFIAQHRQWLKWWHVESKKPVRDEDGNIIEGTMAIPIQAGYPGYLIQEYLKKFPDRAKLGYDYAAECGKNQKKK